MPSPEPSTLQDFESDLIEALTSPSTQKLQGCAHRLRTFVDAIRHGGFEAQPFQCRALPGAREADKVSLLHTIKRISLLARTFADWQHSIQDIATDVHKATTSVLWSMPAEKIPSAATKDGSMFDRTQGGCQSTASTPQLRAEMMRSWLLDHIDHPFPSNTDKESIVENSNATTSGTKGHLTLGQCTLWFINARRRSGWTHWSRRFANGDRNRIRAIVAAIRGHSPPPNTSGVDRPDEIETRLEELVVAKEDLDRHLSKHELAELCRREFQKVIDWIQQGPGQKVGDWMDEIAAEAKTFSSKKRKCGVDDDDDDDEGKARKVVRDTRSTRRQVAKDEGSSSTANIEEVEVTEPVTPSRRAAPPRRDFSGPSTCSYSSFSSFVSGNTMANSSTTSLTSFDEQPTHSSCPVTAFDGSSPLVNTGSSGESSPSASYESPPALTPDAEAFVRRYLEEQRAQNAESMATSAPHTAHQHSPPPPERLIRKLPARGVAQAQYSEGNVFRPPVTAQAATGANWGLPATPATIRSTNTSRQASLSSVTPDYGGWQPFVGED